MDECIPQRPGHMRTYLGNDHLGIFRGRFGIVHGNSKRTESMLIREGQHTERYIHREDLVGKQTGYEAEMAGRNLSSSFINRLPRICPRKQRIVDKIRLIPG